MKTDKSMLPGVFVLGLLALILAVFLMTDDTNYSKSLGGSENGTVEILGVPGEIVVDAINAGGLNVMLYGSFNEKHNFAKGYTTKYGRMSFNTDDYLKYKMKWSEKKIHQVGHSLGISVLRD
jgi:hypothetical protein